MDTPLTDPLGRSITLHDHTWHGHILKRHPEMRPYRRRVEQAITDPAEIRFSDADPDRRWYYAPSHNPRFLIIVAADVVAGFVCTAHLVRQVKGKLEWSPPKP